MAITACASAALPVPVQLSTSPERHKHLRRTLFRKIEYDCPNDSKHTMIKLPINLQNSLYEVAKKAKP